ncbi:hypothetical protein MTO96_001383 [Rhipicephalus appendiculatus]
MTLRAHGASRDASSKEVVPPIRCPLVFHMPQESTRSCYHPDVCFEVTLVVSLRHVLSTSTRATTAVWLVSSAFCPTALGHS